MKIACANCTMEYIVFDMTFKPTKCTLCLSDKITVTTEKI